MAKFGGFAMVRHRTVAPRRTVVSHRSVMPRNGAQHDLYKPVEVVPLLVAPVLDNKTFDLRFLAALEARRVVKSVGRPSQIGFSGKWWNENQDKFSWLPTFSRAYSNAPGKRSTSFKKVLNERAREMGNKNKPTTKLNTGRYTWINGKCVLSQNAKVDVLTHTLHYGLGFFEGIRIYLTDDGPAIFRAEEHLRRLSESAKIYGFKLPYSEKELLDGILELLKKNGTAKYMKKNDIASYYIRPLAIFDKGPMGINPSKNPIKIIISSWEWGAYLGNDAIENGVQCCISSYRKLDIPAMSKCVGHYPNAIQAKLEAIKHGYDEAIFLTAIGNVSEGTGENIFVVKDGVVHSPPSSDLTLQGITARTVIEILKDKDIPFSWKSLTRAELYTVDEVFLTGTAAEVTGVSSIDGRDIGHGGRGKLTKMIQELYFETVKGRNKNYQKYLTYFS